MCVGPFLGSNLQAATFEIIWSWLMKSLIRCMGMFAFLSTPAFAAELVVNNCDGSPLSASKLHDATAGSFEVFVDAGQPGVEQYIALMQGSKTDNPQRSAAVRATKAAFSSVPAGEYRACLQGERLVSRVVFIENVKPAQYAGTLIGLSALGAGGIVAARQDSGNGAAENTLLAAESSESAEAAIPVAGSTAEQTPTTVVSSGCSKTKRKASASVGTLDADDCGAGETPDPLSPYN